MNSAEQLRYYNELGLDIYVPLDFDEAALAEFSNTPLPDALGASEPEPEPIPLPPEREQAPPELEQAPPILDEDIPHEADIDTMPAKAKREPISAALAIDAKPARRDIAQIASELATPAPVLSPVANIEPFHWLVARAGFVSFVCDIKQPRLQGVWHGAALELLSDIAIALGDQQTLKADYFSWPLAADLNLGDADLPDFLASYLAKTQRSPLYVCLGNVAAKQLAEVSMPDAQIVSGDNLGALFKSAQAKRDLWQRLKPWVRR